MKKIFSCVSNVRGFDPKEEGEIVLCLLLLVAAFFFLESLLLSIVQLEVIFSAALSG